MNKSAEAKIATAPNCLCGHEAKYHAVSRDDGRGGYEYIQECGVQGCCCTFYLSVDKPKIVDPKEPEEMGWDKFLVSVKAMANYEQFDAKEAWKVFRMGLSAWRIITEVIEE